MWFFKFDGKFLKAITWSRFGLVRISCNTKWVILEKLQAGPGMEDAWLAFLATNLLAAAGTHLGHGQSDILPAKL